MGIFGFTTITHQDLSGQHVGRFQERRTPDCRGEREQYCDCGGPLDLLMTIEGSSVRKLYHPVCQRDVREEFWQDAVDSSSPIPVQAHWEEDTDWETGYTEGWLVIESPRKDQL